jgi:hypothetical protein
VIVHTFLDLPSSTAEADEGPVIEQCPGKLTVRYDLENESGVVWTTLAFDGAMASRFTPDPACEAWMVGAYSRVCVVDESPWLEELRRLSAKSGERIPDDRRHLLVYFDHHGCLEVVARGARLDDT